MLRWQPQNVSLLQTVLIVVQLCTVTRDLPTFLPFLRLTEEHITKIDRYSLGLAVVVQRRLTKLTANAALFVTAERELLQASQHVSLVTNDGRIMRGV